MTQQEIRRSVLTINDTIATNNPTGLTTVLKAVGYPVDNRFDSLSHADLTKALWDLYNTDKAKWAQVIRSVPFNYEKTDASTSPATRATFESITRSFNPVDDSLNATARGEKKWYQTAAEYLLGATTTVTYGPGGVSSPKISPWFYFGLIIAIITILVILWFAFKG